MIVGLVSCYREGRLAEDAVRSLLPACQTVIVADGPISDATGTGRRTRWDDLRRSNANVIIHESGWKTDAFKRTFLLEKTRRYGKCWGVILDGDELLLWPEQLPALIEHHEAQAEQVGKEPLRVPLRLRDGDGTTSVMTGRVIRLDLVEEWLISSYHVRLRNGVEVSLANGKLVAGDEPDSLRQDVTTGMQLRRPLHGEPHILHRPHLRDPQRAAQRQSVAEGDEFDRLVQGAGLSAAQGETVKDERTKLWLPT